MSLGDEILSLVPKSEMRDIFCDFAEVALDSSLEEGVMKDIPVLGTLFKFGNVALAIKDRIFIKKVGRFLSALDNIPAKEIELFMNDLGDTKIRQMVGEKIVLLLDRQDDLDKTELLGEFFLQYVARKIDRETFEMLSHSISMTYLPDIADLWYFDENPDFLDDALGLALASSGLAVFTVDVFDLEASGTAKTKNRYRLSNLGNKLAHILKERKERPVHAH